VGVSDGAEDLQLLLKSSRLLALPRHHLLLSESESMSLSLFLSHSTNQTTGDGVLCDRLPNGGLGSLGVWSGASMEDQETKDSIPPISI
jgi:hypothetical protein